MTRSRRRALAVSASFAVHLLAFLVLTPVVAFHVRTRLDAPDPSVVQVQLIRERDGLGRTTPKAPEELVALAPSAPGAPQPPPAPPAPPPSPEDDDAPLGVIAQSPPLDIDPLFRAPFRTAAGQAEAALRAGLGCAHVDLQQLPQDLVERCALQDEHLKLAKTGPANT